MYKHFAVPAAFAGDNFTSKINGKNVSRSDFVKADAMRLHQEECWIVRQPDRNMAAGEITLSTFGQDFSREHEFLPQLTMRH